MWKCPFCGGELELLVKKCRHCGEWLTGSHQTGSRQLAEKGQQNIANGCGMTCGCLFFCIIVAIILAAIGVG